MAQTTLTAAGEKGYKVPEDLQIIAYDGSFSKWSLNSLTAVEQPISDMAKTIVKLLSDVIEGKPSQIRTVLCSRLVIGGTTK